MTDREVGWAVVRGNAVFNPTQIDHDCPGGKDFLNDVFPSDFVNHSKQ